MLDLVKDNRIGTLRHIAEVVQDAQVAARRDGSLPPDRLGELRTEARNVKELWHQIATTAHRHLAQYESGIASAEDIEETFAMLMQATQVLAMCSDALVAIPYRTAAELEKVVAQEQDRLYPALPQVGRVRAAVC